MPRVHPSLLVASIATFALAGGCLLTTDLDSLSDGRGDASSGGPGEGGLESGASSSGSSSGPDSGGDAAEAGPSDPDLVFADDFDREDGPVGNGWTDPLGRYVIRNHQVPVVGDGYSFQETYLYRSSSVEARDLAVSIELTPLGLPAVFPQVHLRATPGEQFVCYAAGIPFSDSVFFMGRCTPGGNFSTLGEQTLSENLVIGQTYRLTIAATGTDPVHLRATLEKKTKTGFVEIGRKEVDDVSPDRVVEAGMFGVSANGTTNYVYDNFVARRAR